MLFETIGTFEHRGCVFNLKESKSGKFMGSVVHQTKEWYFLEEWFTYLSVEDAKESTIKCIDKNYDDLVKDGFIKKRLP